MRQEGMTQPGHVTPLWAFLWLVAAFVIAVTATVAVYNYELVPIQATARLTGMILVGEALWYSLILMLPADCVVPPGRTLLTVPLAMVTRVLMAMGAAQVAVVGSDQTFDQLWRAFHSGLWLAAVIQVVLLGVYLWLVRSALEVPREELAASQTTPPQVDYATEFRIPTPPPDEETAQRQDQLLSALMETPDAPVEEMPEAAEELVTGAAPEPDADEIEEEQPAQEPPEEEPSPWAEMPETEEGQTEPEEAEPEQAEEEQVEEEETEEEEAEEEEAEVEQTEEQEAEEEEAEAEQAEAEQAEEEQAEEEQAEEEQAEEEQAEEEEAEPEPGPAQMAMDLSELVPVAEATVAEDIAAEEADDGDATDTLPPVTPAPGDDAAEPMAEEPPRPEPAEPEAAAPPPEAETAVPAGAGAVTPQQQAAIRQVIAQISTGTPAEISRSDDGRIYALLGATPTDDILAALDALFAALLATTDALHAGSLESVILMADAGALVAACSHDYGAQILIAADAGTKVGQLSVLSRRAGSAAGTLDLGNECSLVPATLTALPSVEQTPEVLDSSDMQSLMAFSGDGRDVVVAAPPADAPLIAAAAEAVHEAAVSLAGTMEMGSPDRILIEGATSGLVIGLCISDTELLFAVKAEATAKMGAANIALGNLRDAMRGEA